MPKKTSSPKKAKGIPPVNKQPDTLVWVRLPQTTNLAGIKKLGIKGAACYGGDTCIAATEANPEAGLIVKPDLGTALKGAGLVPKAACYGGDTCIV